MPPNQDLFAIHTAPDDVLVNTQQAALFLSLTPVTLEVWRATKRQQIPYIKSGGRNIRYRLGDLRAWLQAQRVEAI